MLLLDEIIQNKTLFLEKIFGRNNVKISRDQKNFSVACPICNKSNGKLKLAIRVVDDVCHCWVCGWSSRSFLPIVIRYFKNYSDEYRIIFKNNSNPSLFEDNVQNNTLKLPDGFKLLSLFEQEEKLENYKFFAYLKKRSIDTDDLWKYKLGIASEQKYFNRIIIPSFDIDGNLNYFTSRSISSKSFMKYLTCGRSKNDIIFNELYLDFAKPVKICEGPFDMFKLGSNTTCLQGCELSEDSKLFNTILLNKSEVVLCLDSDMRYKTQVLAKTFHEYDINVKILDIGNNHDPGEMSKISIQEKINQSCLEYSWEDYIKSKLNNIKFRNLL
jgi:hypothetical protein